MLAGGRNERSGSRFQKQTALGPNAGSLEAGIGDSSDSFSGSVFSRAGLTLLTRVWRFLICRTSGLEYKVPDCSRRRSSPSPLHPPHCCRRPSPRSSEHFRIDSPLRVFSPSSSNRDRTVCAFSATMSTNNEKEAGSTEPVKDTNQPEAAPVEKKKREYKDFGHETEAATRKSSSYMRPRTGLNAFPPQKTRRWTCQRYVCACFQAFSCPNCVLCRSNFVRKIYTTRTRSIWRPSSSTMSSSCCNVQKRV